MAGAWRALLADLRRILAPTELLTDAAARAVYARDASHLTLGASPRATMMLFRASQAMAAVQGRSYVIPDDAKTLAAPVLEHRLILHPESRLRRVTVNSVLRDIMKEVPVPAGEANWKRAQ